MAQGQAHHQARLQETASPVRHVSNMEEVRDAWESVAAVVQAASTASKAVEVGLVHLDADQHLDKIVVFWIWRIRHLLSE